MKFLKALAALGVAVAGIVFFSPTTFGQQSEEATLIKKARQPTAEEREFSKEFRRLYPGQEGKVTQLLERARKWGINEEIGYSIGIGQVPFTGFEPLSGQELLVDLSCKSDSIVFGTVKSKTAHLTDDNGFVYTRNIFIVDDAIKNYRLRPVKPGEEIQVIRPGGLIKIDDQLIRIEDKSYPQLQSHEKYLIFLRFAPEAKGYMSVNANAAFLLSDGRISQLQGSTSIELSRDTSGDFFGYIRAVNPEWCEKGDGRK